MARTQKQAAKLRKRKRCLRRNPNDTPAAHARRSRQALHDQRCLLDQVRATAERKVETIVAPARRRRALEGVRSTRPTVDLEKMFRERKTLRERQNRRRE